MIEINDFYNAGFGWICRHCDRDMAGEPDQKRHSRVFLEGEAESKSPKLSNAALAKWYDAARTILTCPRCGITEPVEKS